MEKPPGVLSGVGTYDITDGPNQATRPKRHRYHSAVCCRSWEQFQPGNTQCVCSTGANVLVICVVYRAINHSTRKADPHRIKKELSICQSLPCLDLVSFPVLSQIKPQAPLQGAYRYLIRIAIIIIVGPNNMHFSFGANYAGFCKDSCIFWCHSIAM